MAQQACSNVTMAKNKICEEDQERSNVHDNQ